MYAYKTIFNPVNPELGTIPGRTIKIFQYIILNLSDPCLELNANKIDRGIFLKPTIGHIKINLFPSC